ncbi:MAG: DNA repair and recombination protein RadA [Nitrososphaerota archaeon]|jgi:DNA repair protein RadA|nr:DNA repair and recombination protein RadA [Nitrososphaerota archaeon]MDG6930795.1 DNA repair and recombination protein RadA [Nitrososphaerota archaeon]MDG6932955.1 DNA repair and recombination protein RadA [Nitrososphaerota archaeon]MDG6936457.1 DNA repair and recombination protein RadA [Nitrososphaerota archaeon]MDG6944704.1 DNA repair and recombination protein RadA [Nitrososphaerota archaeon]
MGSELLMSEDLSIDNIAGIGPVTKQKLNDGGIRNIMDLASRNISDVADLIGGDSEKASDFITKARNFLVEKGVLSKDFMSATELYKIRKSIERISTGAHNLDGLFGGGIETGAITELYGEFGSGKTQICHTLSVVVQMPKEKGGLDGSIIYIDTENTFRPERIAEIAENRGLDPLKVMERIIVARAYNSSHQELLLKEVGKYIENEKVRLVIVDSVTSHYRSDFPGRGTLAERQQRLNGFMHQLLRTAEMYNIAAVVTNQVQSSPDSFFGDPTKPVGGHVVAHMSTYRVYLRKSGKARVARMVDSPYMAEREVIFMVNEKGIEDAPEDKKK